MNYYKLKITTSAAPVAELMPPAQQLSIDYFHPKKFHKVVSNS